MIEDKPKIWPPAPTTPQVQENAPEPRQTRNRSALLLGFLAGLLYDGVVWAVAYQNCYLLGRRGVWALQMPLGLAAPLTIEFVAGLGVGLLVLLLFLVLFRRSLRDLSRGLAASLVPFALVFLFVLHDYLTTPIGGHIP